MRKKVMLLLNIIISVVLVIWILLTLYVEREGEEKSIIYGNSTSKFKALILYDPDPFYNLDMQVCNTFAITLSKNGWQSTVNTVAASKNLKHNDYDLYIFCANTYNWYPDKVISNFIKNHKALLKDKNVVAITLGSGSTKRAQRILEKLISNSKANLIASKSFWLLKPNDDSKTNASNVVIANRKVEEFANEILKQF